VFQLLFTCDNGVSRSRARAKIFLSPLGNFSLRITLKVNNKFSFSLIFYLFIIFSLYNVIPVHASIYFRDVAANQPVYISQFWVIEDGDTLQCRFSLLDKNSVYTKAGGTVSINILDSRQVSVYENSFKITESSFGTYQLILTGAEFTAYLWNIPKSSIEKGAGFGVGSATLTFSSEGSIWETEYDLVPIPTYTQEELDEQYEMEYQRGLNEINKIITTSPFEITVVSVGSFKYSFWGEETTYFRVDIKIRNIGSENQYLFGYPVIIDDLYNQYDADYLGTLELGEIYPSVIRAGYVLFPPIDENANDIRIIFTQSHYPENIVYEFSLNRDEYSTRENSEINCYISTPVRTGVKSLIYGAITPSVSNMQVDIHLNYPDGSKETRTITTDSNGEFDLEFIPEKVGMWSATASWNGNLDYLGAVSDLVSFSVSDPPTTGHIGIIVSTGSGVREAIVTSIVEPTGQETLIGTTNSNGLIEFIDVKAGEYTFRVSKEGYTTTTESISLTAGSSKSATITIEKEKEGIPGFPLFSIFIGILMASYIVHKIKAMNHPSYMRVLITPRL